MFRPAVLTTPLALALAIVLGLSQRVSAEQTGARRPNVLFIAVDDLRPELNCYGTNHGPIQAITPNLDRLAETGIRFTNAYCNQAVCGASRLSLMTGLYPEFTKERTYHVTDWRKRWSKVVTLNQHFTENGYTTVGLGKIYHNTSGIAVDDQNWTQWIKVAGKGYANPESLEQLRETKSSLPGVKTTKTRGPSTEAADDADLVYSDGLRAMQGVRQIKRLARSGEPFFLAVGFTKPHLPFTAPTKYWDLYDRDAFLLPANLGIPPGYPQWARNRMASELRAYSDIPSKGTPADFPDELNKRLLHGYHACVSYTDHNVGLLLNALEEANMADSTIVVFWADHGWKLGDHSSWCKHTNFECDTRVPLLVRCPKAIRESGDSQALIELIDLYPTLCELCDLKRPGHLQGKSFASVLKEPSSKHRDYAYSSYPHSDWKSKRRVIGHSIRDGRVRYTEWWDAESDEVVARVATDIKSDPGETTNLLPDQEELGRTLSESLRSRVLAARTADVPR